jgi:low temperature requirement protein LtrA
VIGMALLVAGSLVDEAIRVWLWTLAVAIDYAGPAWLTRERLRGLQRVAVVHFAERYSLFVIICLGESIVAIGLSASERPIDADLIIAVALGFVATAGLWWTTSTASPARQRRACAITTTPCSRPPTPTATCTS